jgi:hypothetical protein
MGTNSGFIETPDILCRKAENGAVKALQCFYGAVFW